MEKPDEGKELKELSEVYEELKSDARQIIVDLQGGVTMWREAAAGAAASAGFIVILILTTFHYTPPNNLELWTYVVGSGIVAVLMGVISVVGFAKYFQLRRRYSGLFSRVKQLG
jgi:hypothetical protein